ncbi:coiled-coil domain-containing protein 175 [Dipodomys spectabilis]|uniref:coiled-coil domain-containing protein 175 n=1 Tax=Dipodomys spectabilis TaxID=105255 RepID=UPI001C54BDA6|nr:coiled-coil domain-containing protein 175 [Dipodomys spectabilis]
MDHEGAHEDHGILVARSNRHTRAWEVVSNNSKMAWKLLYSLVPELGRNVAISASLSLDLSTIPPTLGSSVATTALEQLFAIEQSLKSDDFKCNEEASIFLKDIAVAVKQLEEMRKNTIDLLEIESMELSRLYFLLETVPGIINREMEECIRDARKLNVSEMKEIVRRIVNIDNEIAFLKKSIQELNHMNESLHERQEELAKEHQHFVQSLNGTMEEKAMVNVFINETYHTISKRKEEVVEQKQWIQDTHCVMEKHESQYLLRKEEIQTKITEIKTQCDSKRKETYVRKKILDRLKTKMKEMNQTVTDTSEVVSEHNLETSRLQSAINTWKDQVENMKKACTVMDEKMKFFAKHKEQIDTTTTNEKGEYIKKIKEVLINLQQVQVENTNLRGNMFTVSRQHKIFLSDEEKAFMQYKKLYEENQKQIAFIAEKENFLSQRKADIKNMEEGLGALEDLHQATNDIYREQIKILGDNLERESQRSVINQWKIACSRKRHQRWLTGLKGELKDIAQQIEEAELKRIDLLEETTQRQEEIEEFVAEIERLSITLKDEKHKFVRKQKRLLKELNMYEDLIVQEELVYKQKEEELIVRLPQLHTAEEEYGKTSQKLKDAYAILQYMESMLAFNQSCNGPLYHNWPICLLLEVDDALHETFALQHSAFIAMIAQQQEAALLKNNIYQFTKDIARYFKNMEKVKTELKATREEESRKIKSHYECLRKLEIEIQTNDDKVNLLTTENEKIKKHIAYLWNEADNYKKEREFLGQSSNDLSWQLLAQQARYTDLWAEFQATVKDSGRNGEEILQELTTLIKKLKERDESIENMSRWLEGNIKKLRSVMKEELPEDRRKQYFHVFDKIVLLSYCSW